MNRHNAKMNGFALRLLGVGPSDRVLEVGFGGGLNIPFLLRNAAFLAGVDRSDTVVRSAQRRFAAAIGEGRAIFREGSIEELPFNAGEFTKVCTANTVYFWNSLHTGCAELHRVLAPGGHAVIAFLPKEWMDRGGFPPDIFTSRTSEEVVAALVEAEFTGVRVDRLSVRTRWNAIIAQR
jgi:SAM-dependent methyltransferase